MYESGIRALPSAALFGGVLAATGFHAQLVFLISAMCLAVGGGCLLFRFATRHKRIDASG